MSNLVTLKWWSFEYKGKFEKRSLLFRSEKGIFYMFFEKYVPICPIKWQLFKVFVKLHKSPLLVVKSYSRSLRFETIFVNLMPLKIDEKCFLFHLKSSFRSQDIYIFVLTFWSCRKNCFIRKRKLISNFMTSQPG